MKFMSLNYAFDLLLPRAKSVLIKLQRDMLSKGFENIFVLEVRDEDDACSAVLAEVSSDAMEKDRT